MCCFVFFHSSSRNGMEHCRTSLLGLIRSMLWKTRIWKVPVIPGTSGVCWTRMVVSLGGRKLKLWPSLMLPGHHVLHWWAMKKYKRGQMGAMTANLLSFEIWWNLHQFLSMQIQTKIPQISLARSLQQLWDSKSKELGGLLCPDDMILSWGMAKRCGIIFKKVGYQFLGEKRYLLPLKSRALQLFFVLLKRWTLNNDPWIYIMEILPLVWGAKRP